MSAIEGDGAPEGAAAYAAAQIQDDTKEIFSGSLTIAEALAKLRARLLDLSTRNRLLNYKFPKNRSVQFTDVRNLDVLYERLIDGRLATLSPVPEPSDDDFAEPKPDARQQARKLGISTEYELDAPVPDQHAGRRGVGIQTLFFPEDLERLCKKVSAEAKTVIEETGSNMLYLVFGFLEFFEADQSEKPLLAPLISVPITLSRGDIDPDTRIYRYHLQYNGEDISENFTLREKLRADFRLNLPELGDEELPEAYFASVTDAVKAKRRWRVRRRLSLAMLSFGKLAIWADLDPVRNPILLQHPLLRTLFEGAQGSGSDPIQGEDYEIDGHPGVNLPLIYDADSSQHSAVIDAMAGKNMVINGPPGTGKSQTITNIIATCLAAGKRVLFVSEKVAALEVVRQRLDRANLGQFVLELHSHKTQKKRLLDDIQARIDATFRAPGQMDAKLGILTDQKRRLQRHAELMGLNSCNELGLTVSDALWAAEVRRQALADLDQHIQRMTIAAAAGMTHADVEGRKSLLTTLGDRFRGAGGAGPKHPWTGFEPKLLAPGDEQEIGDIAMGALHEAELLLAACAQFEAMGSGPVALDVMQSRTPELLALQNPPAQFYPELLGRMFSEADPMGRASRGTLDGLGLQLQLIRDGRKLQQTTLQPGVTPAAELGQQIRTAASATRAGRTLIAGETLRQDIRTIAHAGSDLRAACEEFERLTRLLDLRFEPVGSTTLVGLSVAVTRLERFPIAELAVADLRTREHALRDVAGRLADALSSVETLARRWNIGFDGTGAAVDALSNPSGLADLQPDASTEPEVLQQARAYAQSMSGEHTLVDLDQQMDQMRAIAAELERCQVALARAAQETGQPWDGSRIGAAELACLTQVAAAAPQGLLEFRAKTLESPRAPQLATRAMTERNRETDERLVLERDYYLDAAPPAAELKNAIRVFRQRGDSIFNVFRSDWRAAKAMFLRLPLRKRKWRAEDMATECGRFVSWQEKRAAFIDNNEYKQYLGPLFQGIDTDFIKLDGLVLWYQASLGAMSEAGTLLDRVSLTDMDPRRLVQLSGRAKTVGDAVAALNLKLDQARSFMPAKVQTQLDNTQKWSELVERLEERAHYIEELLTFFGRHARAHIAPRRAVELLEAKHELASRREHLALLAQGGESLRAAAGAELAAVVGNESTPWRTRIELVTGTCGQLSTICGVVETFAGNSVSPANALRFVSGKLALDKATEALSGAGVVPPANSWGEHLAAAKDLSQRAADLVGKLSEVAPEDRQAADVIEAVEATNLAERTLRAIEADRDMAELFGAAVAGEQTDFERLSATWTWGELVTRSKLPVFAKRALLSADAVVALSSLRSISLEAQRAFAAMMAELQKLHGFGTFTWSVWVAHASCKGGTQAVHLVERTRIAVEARDAILPWSQYLAARSNCSAAGFGGVIGLLEAGHLPAEALPAAFERVFYSSIGKEMYRIHPELGFFSGESHDKLRAEYVALDKEIIQLTGHSVAHKVDRAKVIPHGQTGIRATDLTEMHLLRRELGKSKRHIPIRQLIKRAGGTLQALKPCFMMGPLSVAQYLEQGAVAFDVVVMDEASQLKPEDALGAVARGAQLIVVGDPKQLPPTSFFDRMLDSNDDDEDDAVASMDGTESILDICQQLYSPVRTLKWHYRSQHESLIAFSNFHFYDNKLIVFPSPYARGSRLGVSWRYVREGIYKDRRNVPEAIRVADAVLEHMLKHPEESLGVVCLNQTQRDLIKDLLDKKLQAFEETQQYMAAWEEKGLPFFVKNLENVQGDERDAIFISVTFGKAPGVDKPRQNFGPISRPIGWRRLNVLFTRAKRRISLFTSMQPEDIVVDAKTPAGTAALKDYLDFVKRGVLVQTEYTDREPDSDFEVSVATVLRERGYEVKPQLGVANFFIDLAVRNPDRPGEFLAGIECDGATYHSSASARDRDRIRQEILESLGWKGRIWRIWSPDWFYNPRREINRLLAFLEQRREISAQEPMEVVEEVEESAEATPADVAAVEAVAVAVVESAEDAFVDLGDEVTYCFLDRPQDRHTFRIVERAINGTPGVANEQAPLSIALLGLQVGEVGVLAVKGQLDRRVRVIKIERVTPAAT